MRSSYKKNEYGELFTALTNIYRPKLAVELGVLDGYSLIAMAKGGAGKVVGVDLFGEYKFKHGRMPEIYAEAKKNDVSIELIHQSAFDAPSQFNDKSIDFFHVDISNTGDSLREVFDVWNCKLSDQCVIIFEGGSLERDQVEWMKKHNKTTVNRFKQQLKRSNRYEFFTFTPFPSLTICRKV